MNTRVDEDYLLTKGILSVRNCGGGGGGNIQFFLLFWQIFHFCKPNKCKYKSILKVWVIVLWITDQDKQFYTHCSFPMLSLENFPKMSPNFPAPNLLPPYNYGSDSNQPHQITKQKE